jgi:N6-L-threonylcarbamoyladenine synthase
VPFPFLLLLISGGHCQLMAAEGVGRYRLYGATIDDAVGEAFDKTAKLLGLPYPGGPEIEKLARGGNPRKFALPRPMAGRQTADFSFSGLKTAVRQIATNEALSAEGKADLAASFQAAVVDVLKDRMEVAMRRFRSEHAGLKGDLPLVVAGGVAANGAIRAMLRLLCAAQGFSLHAPPPSLCSDNAAMVAWAGVERLALGLIDALDAPPRARWPLEAAERF